MKESNKRMRVKAGVISSILLLFISLSVTGCNNDTAEDTSYFKPLTFEFTQNGKFLIGDPWSTVKYKLNESAVSDLPQTITAEVLKESLGIGDDEENSIRPDTPYSVIEVKAGDTLCLYASGSESYTNPEMPGDTGYMTLNTTAECYVYGNIMSLLTHTQNGKWNPDSKEVPPDAFLNLFYYESNLKNHSTESLWLPAEKLSDRCYKYMFINCENLTRAPELPAMDLADNCYEYMFEGCDGLTEAPALPATTLKPYCYSGMFNSCYGLVKAPLLPAVTMTEDCYGSMFAWCKKLTEAPDLPATKLASHCYHGIFNGCEKLSKAPELPAKELEGGCYYEMFNECKSLTAAPLLPAENLQEYCYWKMFYGCTNLNSITCLAKDISETYCTGFWLVGTAENGTFTKVAATNWATGEDGIPTGWTVVDYQ